jgi:predicted RNase H-like HicB family nuclease
MNEIDTNATATTDITPALSKDVPFTQKIQDVDTALKSRAQANRNIKHAWAGVVKVLTKYDHRLPPRRVDVAQAANMVSDIEILQPANAALDNVVMLAVVKEANYEVRQLSRQRKAMAYLEEKFPGLTAAFTEIDELHDIYNMPRERDEDATKAARAELQAAVDKYAKALEAYDETVETVANVKEYISVVKDVAEISAIAQGQQREQV